MEKGETKKGKAKGIKKEPKASTPPENEKSFDFGGIPARDLKKNLGCG